MYLDSWQSHELRVAVLRNALESGVERTKNKSKVTQELVEKKKKYSRITNKKRKESLTQMKKEGKQQGERIGKLGQIK